MNYGRIVSSAYSWVSMKKAFWFLVFFWVSLPVILFFPSIARGGAANSLVSSFVILLYDVLYVALVLAVVFLIQFSLSEKKMGVSRVSAGKLAGLIALIFVELFYIFLWGARSAVRTFQLLFLMLSFALYYYFLLTLSDVALVLFALSLTAYFFMVVYNAVRLFFTTTLFFSRDVGIKEAINETLSLTHTRFGEAFYSIIISAVLALIIFFFISIALGTIASVVLSYFFLNSAALSFGFNAAFLFALAPALIAYHYSITESYAQLAAHKEATHAIKRILAHRVLHPAKLRPARRAPARKLAKKKKRR